MLPGKGGWRTGAEGRGALLGGGPSSVHQQELGGRRGRAETLPAGTAAVT